MHRRRKGLRAVLAAALAVGGCVGYSDWVGQMERQIAQDRPKEAIAVLEDHAAAGRNSVLLLLNRSILYRMAEDFQRSNADLEAAKLLIGQLSVTSVTEQTGALTINDTMRSFVGEPYEQVLVHVYEALNYLEMGQPDQARVEALQLDVELNALGDDPLAGAGFARYLSGLVFETLGEWDDAMIADRKAFEAYRRAQTFFVPTPLRGDLLRLTRHLGLHDELARYRKEFESQGGALQKVADVPEDSGELVFTLHSGLAPVKREAATGVTTMDGRMVMVSMPYYDVRPPRVTSARLHIGAVAKETATVDDIEALAVGSLEKRKPEILARAVARAVIKYNASNEAQNSSEALAFMVNVAGILTERADTRSWSTLPSRISLLRWPLTAGHYRINIDLLGDDGVVVAQRTLDDVSIVAGQKRFLSLHWVSPDDLVPVGGRYGRSERRH